MVIMEWISKLPEIVHAITLLISGASVIAALTPSKSDNDFLNMISSIINVLGLNVNKAKNADDI